MSQYDYLVVGAGLSGAVFANAARKAGKSVLVIDRRDHIAGNVYTEQVEGINVHRYGAHIFHTSMRDVWDYELARGQLPRQHVQHAVQHEHVHQDVARRRHPGRRPRQDC